MDAAPRDDGIDLPAIRANLKQLGHDVNEESIIGMLHDIDISRLLAKLPRASADPACANTAGTESPAGCFAVDTPKQAADQCRRRSREGTGSLTMPSEAVSHDTLRSRSSAGSASLSARLRAALARPSSGMPSESGYPGIRRQEAHNSTHYAQPPSMRRSESLHSGAACRESAARQSQHSGTDTECASHSDDGNYRSDCSQGYGCGRETFNESSIVGDGNDASDEDEGDGFYMSARTASMVCLIYIVANASSTVILYARQLYARQCNYIEFMSVVYV